MFNKLLNDNLAIIQNLLIVATLMLYVATLSIIFFDNNLAQGEIMIIEIIALSLFVVIAIILLIIIAFISHIIVVIVIDSILKKRFLKDFVESVLNSQPSWQQIKQIAKTRYLKKRGVITVIQQCYREVLAGRKQDLAKHQELIESYIEQYKKDIPFADLPADISIHLEKLKKHINDNNHSLAILAEKIQELVAKNNKKIRNQRYYTTISMFIGLAGFIFAIYAHFLT